MALELRTLNTAAKVMDALGGTRSIQELTGRTANAVYNWRAFGRFPANTYVAMTAALRASGYIAPASLWRMVKHSEPAE